MNVRPAILEDQPALLRLLGELREQTVDDQTLQEGLLLLINDPRRTVLVVEDSDGPQAMAAVNLVYKLPKIEARIDEVIVGSNSRGKGYGRLLLEACESWAWEHDAHVIEFTSRPSRDAANALYQKLGYEVRETNVYQKKRKG